MTVTVSDFYVIGCPQCCAEIERITRAAIRDFTVTKLTFNPGHRHNHEVEKGQGQIAAARPSAPAAATVLAGQQELPGVVQSHQPNGFEATP